MYISKIHIKGFRNFKDSCIEFNDGINVIIGPNNSGKSNLINALALLLDQNKSKRLSADDFCKNITLAELKEFPLKISIELTISQSINENLNSDDLVTVSTWLTKLEEPYQAKLTYEYFLPEKETTKYNDAMNNVNNNDEAWAIFRSDFIRLYTNKLYVGHIKLRNTADSESLQKFDFQFLDALRDVERDMYTGKNTLLRDVLDFFLDYEIKIDPSKDETTKTTEIKAKKQTFSEKANDLLFDLKLRMERGKEQILSYAKETGASFNNAEPNFEGSISEVDLYSMLKLIVEYETGIKIPATHNGLGYNNLIFMSLLLAKMQVNTDGNYLGCNAKVFPVLAIEEPEAHLHPAMQYKFLKFLKKNIEEKKKVRQIFITTHSTQITAAVSLDEIICLYDNNNSLKVGYPGRVFSDNQLGQKSKAYVKRFLDATKSDMLFASKVIMVEGISELLLIPIMAKYLGHSIEDHHIAIIHVGGRYFNYFLEMFDSTKPNTINKKVACITDRDPVRKSRSSRYFEKCYPYEFNIDQDNFEYRDNAQTKITEYHAHPNINFFSQDFNKGKTLEYDVVYNNPTTELILTESLSNKEEIQSLMQSITDQKLLSETIALLSTSNENERIKTSITACDWDDVDKQKAIVASRYLNSVGKGENALELAEVFELNLVASQPKSFNIPSYIKEAIEWICQ